jgi:hypothetical protein
MARASRSTDSPTGSLIGRLASRLDRDELTRRTVRGGTVVQGQLATEALEAVGARAMTLDRHVIVSDDFDPSKPEDQALLAHEQYHARHGDGDGGGGGSNFRDAEEVAARAVERMVLHRAMAGGYESGGGAGAGGAGVGGHGHNHLSSDSGGGSVGAAAPTADQRPHKADPDRNPDPTAGYDALRKDGYTHHDVVEMLARKAMNMHDEARAVRDSRHSDAKGSI